MRKIVKRLQLQYFRQNDFQSPLNQKICKSTHSDPGLGDPDLELSMSEIQSLMELLPPLLRLLALSEGNSGKLLEKQSGT